MHIINKTKQSLLIFIISLTASISANNEVTLTANQIQSRLNIVNGYSTECVMHKFYTDAGWTRIDGEIGRNGIDGLYYKKKNGVIREVLVAEGKWNKSTLGWSGKNKLVHQMSQEWVLRTLKRLQHYKPLPEYNTIKWLVSHDQYRARLFKMFPIGDNKIQINIYKIKNKGIKLFDTFIESELRPIIITAPKNNFEREILTSYNTCRSKALHKYFPMLSSQNLKLLLQDNYLQKHDIRFQTSVGHQFEK
jgi:hypothetical protein